MPRGTLAAELARQIDTYRQIRRDLGKPLLVNETIPGCLDDAKRAEVVKVYTEHLGAAGFGWMGWALREGIAISTRPLRRQRPGLPSLFHQARLGLDEAALAAHPQSGGLFWHATFSNQPEIQL